MQEFTKSKAVKTWIFSSSLTKVLIRTLSSNSWIFILTGYQILNHLLNWKILFCTELFANTRIENAVRFFWFAMFKLFLDETQGFERYFICALLRNTGALISLMHVVALRVPVPMSWPVNINRKLTYNDFISRFEPCRNLDSFNVNAFSTFFSLNFFWLPSPNFIVVF